MVTTFAVVSGVGGERGLLTEDEVGKMAAAIKVCRRFLASSGRAGVLNGVEPGLKARSLLASGIGELQSFSPSQIDAVSDKGDDSGSMRFSATLPPSGEESTSKKSTKAFCVDGCDPLTRLRRRAGAICGEPQPILLFLDKK